jgi:hypothetical protein
MSIAQTTSSKRARVLDSEKAGTENEPEIHTLSDSETESDEDSEFPPPEVKLTQLQTIGTYSWDHQKLMALKRDKSTTDDHLTIKYLKRDSESKSKVSKKPIKIHVDNEKLIQYLEERGHDNALTGVDLHHIQNELERRVNHIAGNTIDEKPYPPLVENHIDSQFSSRHLIVLIAMAMSHFDEKVRPDYIKALIYCMSRHNVKQITQLMNRVSNRSPFKFE